MRRWGIHVPQLAAFVALAAIMSACGSTAPAPSTSGTTPSTSGSTPGASTQQPGASSTTQTIKRGGTLTYAQPSSYAGADPAMGQNAYQLWQYVGTYMLRRQPESWKLDGDAIEKWEFSSDGLEVTLHVRKGVKWENKPPVNGREVEAKDIVYTLKSITGLQYPDLPPLRFPRKSNLEDMADATAVDKYTVKVKLKNQSSTFIDGLAEYRSPITPDGIREHFGGRDSLANPSPERYLSAGPFTLTKYIDLQEAIYTRYPDYWEKAADGQSKPYLDQVRNIWIADQGTEIAAFLANQISFTTRVSNPEARNQVLATKKDTQMISYEPNSCWYRLAWNTTRKPFDDVRVRTALTLLLDPVETGKALWGEFDGKPLWRYPGNLPYAFPEALSQEEMAKLPHYESPKSQATIDRAKKLLDEAGLSGGFEFEMISSTGAVADGAQLAINQINRVFPNIKIKASPLDNAIQLERAAKRDFDAQYYCYIHEPTAVAMLKTAFHSKGGRNTPALSDAKIDELLDQAAKEIDKTKRDAMIREVQMRTYELNTMLGTTHYVAQMGTQPNVRGMRLGSGTFGQGMYAKEIWLDQ